MFYRRCTNIPDMRSIFVACLCALCASCFNKSSLPADSEIFSLSRRLGEITDKKLEEASGLAASATNPGLLWTLNDSGNPAIVYLIDENLKIKLSCKLKDVKNRDWEDIAIGPGPEEGKSYLYVADIGDNNAKRDVKYIYRFEEPLLGDQTGEILISSFDTIAFQLEDGRKDTETIMIHPETKNVYIVSKREKPVHVYELKYPFNASDTLSAASILTLPLTQIVAGDFSPDGREVLMKDYDNIYYWKMDGKSLVEDLQSKPQILNYTEEPQGEAITFSLDGSGFYTLSEKIKGEKSYLYYYPRK
jgi:hypothetical protein